VASCLFGTSLPVAHPYDRNWWGDYWGRILGELLRVHFRNTNYYACEFRATWKRCICAVAMLFFCHQRGITPGLYHYYPHISRCVVSVFTRQASNQTHAKPMPNRAVYEQVFEGKSWIKARAIQPVSHGILLYFLTLFGMHVLATFRTFQADRIGSSPITRSNVKPRTERGFFISYFST
jgi:hypothetical protein